MRKTLLVTVTLIRHLGFPVNQSVGDWLLAQAHPDGGFHGHWADEHLDAEYTFYGLLALGHLSL